MNVTSSFTDIHNVNDLLGRSGFIGHPVSIGQLFLNQINREQELVFQEQFIVSGLMAAFTDDILCLEEIAALFAGSFLQRLPYPSFSAWIGWMSGYIESS